MKHFFQTMFASIFGVLIAMGLLILGGISFLVGVAASSNSSAEYKPKENTVFKLKLEGTVSDQVTENPFKGLFGDDASVLPISPGKPPILTILALSKRLADYLIG